MDSSQSFDFSNKHKDKHKERCYLSQETVKCPKRLTCGWSKNIIVLVLLQSKVMFGKKRGFTLLECESGHRVCIVLYLNIVAEGKFKASHRIDGLFLFSDTVVFHQESSYRDQLRTQRIVRLAKNFLSRVTCLFLSLCRIMLSIKKTVWMIKGWCLMKVNFRLK